ncbi:MAG: hypothetical protein V3W45_02515 [Sedimentisphaerales bacterium]
MVRTHLQNIVIISVVTLFMIFLYGQIEYTEERYSKWDLGLYRAIAIASPRLNTSINQPFVYRILGPYIVGLLPLSDPIGFYIFTVAASFSVVFLLYFFLYAMGLSTRVSAVTAILFTFNKYLFGFTVWDFFQINDLLSLIYIILLFWAMMRSNWLMFGLVMLLGAITRETVMLMVPVVVAWLFEKKKVTTEAKYAFVAMIPAIFVFLSLRLVIITTGPNLIQAFVTHSVKLYSPETWLRLLLNSFVPLSLLPFVFLKTTIEFFRDKKYAAIFILLVFLSTLFGSNDERLMAPAFLVFYWLIGTIISFEDLIGNKLLFPIVVIGTLISSFHHVICRFHFMSRNLTIIVSICSLLVITVAALVSVIATKKLRQGRAVFRSQNRNRLTGGCT